MLAYNKIGDTMSKTKKKLKTFFKFTVKDSVISIGILAISTVICVLLRAIDKEASFAQIIFILAVLIISRTTDGYVYGIIASVVGVIGINYAFTYPFFEFNFTIAGYPVMFLVMLVVSIITSTLTTRIKHQERMRAETEKEKVRANLLRAISHDLRTPLTSIVGATSAVLENDAVLTPGMRKELLTGVKEDAEWLIRMVENILSITKISGEAAKIDKKDDIAEEVMGEAVRKFKKKFPGIEVSVVAPDELLIVPMDAMLIEQVINNLMENCVHHGKTTTKIELSLVRSGQRAIFSVSDNGEGISEHMFEHLFDGYFSGKELESESDCRRNMGIGLSVCMTIVAAHGGAITAENRSGGGAVFRFTLPIDSEEENHGN